MINMKETYIKDIHKDEIRNGFLVTTGRKKIWNKEIELLMEVDRICKKYDISFFSVSGTLLGAVRHNGFIPWDDAITIGMLRPDYMRFVQVGSQEIKTPYFLQNTYTDNRIISWSKLMDDHTSAIEDWENDGFHQGMFVDIFPMDTVTDGTERGLLIDEMSKELWMCVISPQQVAEGLKNGALTHVSKQLLERIIKMTLPERMNVYEDFCVKHFGESSQVCFKMDFWGNRSKSISKDAFSSISYMDFEQIKVPVLSGFDEFLTQVYGQWRTPTYILTGHEGALMSADIPYDVMLKNINRDLLQCGDYLWQW